MYKVYFGCTETAPGLWTVRFNDPSFRTPSSWEELKEMCSQYRKVLVLGVFDWSNYSHTIVTDIIGHKLELDKHDIGLAAFCPASSAQVSLICPDYLHHFLQANNEPLMFVLEGGLIIKARCGPMDYSSLLNWVLSEKVGKEKRDSVD